MALIPVISKFNFYQQIRLLLRKLRGSHTNDAILLDEKLNITSTLSLDAPNGQVEYMNQESSDTPVQVTVWYNGLTGAMGALPTAYSEWMIERHYRYSDCSAKAFVDLFGHRLYCLDYLAWQKHHLYALAESQTLPPLQTTILALNGQLISGHLPHQVQYARLFSSPVRSMVNLEYWLSLMFNVPAKIIPFTGGWRTAEEECCQLGNTHQTLNTAPMVGRARLEVHAHFDVVLGPMSPEASIRFMPQGDALREVWSCVSYYVGQTLDFSILLTINSAGISPHSLGKGALGLDLCLGHNADSHLHHVRLPAPAF